MLPAAPVSQVSIKRDTTADRATAAAAGIGCQTAPQDCVAPKHSSSSKEHTSRLNRRVGETAEQLQHHPHQQAQALLRGKKDPWRCYTEASLTDAVQSHSKGGKLTLTLVN